MWQRLVDPAAVYNRVAFVYMPLGLIAPLTLDAPYYGTDRIQWMLAALAAQVPMFLLLPLARRIGQSEKFPSAAVNAFALYASVLLRAVVLVLLPAAWGLATEQEWTHRIASATFAQLPLTLMIALASSTFEQHRRLIGSLRQRQRTLLALRESMSQRLEEDRKQLVEQISDELRPSVVDLLETLDATQATTGSDASLQALRALVDEEVRPLSHRLSAAAVEELDLPGDEIEESVSASWPTRIPMSEMLRPRWTGLLFLTVSIGVASRYFEAIEGTLFVLSFATGTFLMMTFWRTLLGRLRPAFWLAAAFVGLASVGSVEIALLVLRSLELPFPEPFTVASGYVALAIAVLISVYQGVQYRRRATEAQLAETVSDLANTIARLRQQLWAQRQQLSRYLHGRVQSTLHAAALRLSSQPAPSAAAIAVVRADIVEALRGIIEPPAKDFSIETVLASIEAIWRDRCAVEAELEPEALEQLAGHPATAEALAELVHEAVGNSVRHGGADQVWLSIDLVADTIVLSVEDNGTLDKNGKPGLGSRLFDELCSEWEIKRRRGRTRVTAVLPLA